MANTRDVIGDQATLDGLVSNTLTSFEEDKAITIKADALRDCTGLTSVNLPNLTEVPKYALAGLGGITEITLLLVHIIRQGGLSYNTNLTTVDLASSSVTSIESNAFEQCPNLTHLIIRSATVPTLGGANAFSGTAIFAGNGGIYVPANLVSAYKAASNWSVFAGNIYPISEYPRQTFDTIADSWSDIIAACANGTYATKYTVGDTKSLDFGSEGVHRMQIVAFNEDNLANGSGKAHITWICRECLPTTYRMNNTETTSGGYGASLLRTYLTDTILPQIPSEVQAAILEVSKIQSPNNNEKDGQTTTEKLWIPSQYEVGMGTSFESTGATYSGYFKSDYHRIKYRGNTAENWRLRSADYGSYWRSVQKSGGGNRFGATAYQGVVPGFCI